MKIHSTQPAWPVTVAILAAAMCLWTPQSGGQSNEAELWRHRNLGKALYESPTRSVEAPAELAKALALAPNSVRDRINYGLALLRAGETARGIAELERAQKQDPRLPHTWFNLGIAYKRLGRHAEAIRQFERMIALAPDEPVAHYNLGLLFDITERSADALREFQAAAKLDPNMVAARNQIYNYFRLHGDEASAEPAMNEFQQARERMEASGETQDPEWCAYAELYDPIQAMPARRDASPPAALRFEIRKLAGAVDARTAGLLVLDSEGAGRADLLAWSRNGLMLYRGGSEPVGNSGLADIREVVSAAAGDYDNDGLPDLCVVTASGVRLFHNVRGRFEETGAALPAGPLRSAVWLDFDHDYDVDLFLLGPRPALLRNRGNGQFEDYTTHFPFVAGNALDAAAFRLTPDTKSTDLAVSFADRKGVLYRDRLRGVFEATPLDAVPSGATGLRALDLDHDGWNDLVFAAAEAVSVARNVAGSFQFVPTRSQGPFALADLEGRGFADLVASNGVARDQGLAQFAAPATPAGLPAATAWAEADFDRDGGADLAAVAPDGALVVATNRTTTRNGWVRVALNGVKNQKLAQGAEIEVKAGNQYQKRIYDGAPLLFGLGGARQADTIRVTWPNGLIQNETGIRPASSLNIKEAPRLSGSCPMVYTWNGHEFQFITDVLGVAPLGASSGDGGYFPVDHDEWVRIPGDALAVSNGRYEVRITEELHEVSYLDHVRLVALDHPESIEIFTNEKFQSPPFPDFRLFGVRKRRYPVGARYDRGRDVLPSILRRDRVYAAGFPHDYAGTAELHALTLDFGAGAARDGRAVLLLNGWVDWADGSTFLSASQHLNGGLVFPFLQVKDAAGAWQTVIPDMGIPAGKPKTVAVDLTGKFRSASREVRIVTNLCLYWDEIFLTEDVDPPAVRMTRLGAGQADLRLRGFSGAAIHPRREQPESFDYARWTPSARWDQTPGFYTRYGDVGDLVAAVDDKLVVMGAGDELRLQFPAAGLPPLPAGWRRDYLLLVDGWAKDADANTAWSQSVEPLPFHAMSAYPYPAGEHYPDDEPHRSYLKAYNTRPAARFVTPLVAGRR